jgi:S-adenosylmethionine uptake transporter
MAAPGVDWGEVPRWALVAAGAGGGLLRGMQVLTRKLGARSAASAMAIYIQVAFILVPRLLGRGRGRALRRGARARARWSSFCAPGSGPGRDDLWIFVVLGLLSAMIGYALSQAYRLGTASVVASYEYVALPLAIFWGWLIFGEIPGRGLDRHGLIAAAGLYVFARERARDRALASARRSGGTGARGAAPWSGAKKPELMCESA